MDWKTFGAAVWRLFRVALALGGTAFLGSLLKMPQLIWATPLISALFKAIRDKFPKATWIPL
jgi:hypothetical protein